MQQIARNVLANLMTDLVVSSIDREKFGKACLFAKISHVQAQYWQIDQF